MVHSASPGVSTPGAAAPTRFNIASAANRLHSQAYGRTPAPVREVDNYHQLCGHIDNLRNVADDLTHASDGIDLLLSALEYGAQGLGLDTSHTLALRGLFGPISKQLRSHAATLSAAVTEPDAQ